MQKFRRMKCRACGHMMFTERTSGFNRYNYYECVNPTCSEVRIPVYLNFCFKCKKGLIDSRDTKQCPNGWYMFWSMTAFLSIMLAFMNILPIPALDGGHVVFLLYEMITRRNHQRSSWYVQSYVGITILILLMIFANLNDILRWLHIM